MMNTTNSIYHKARIAFIDGNMPKNTTVHLSKDMDEEEIKKRFKLHYPNAFVRKVVKFETNHEGRAPIIL